MPKSSKREVRSSTDNNNASLKVKEYKKQYHIQNREKILEKVKEHYVRNREKRLAYGKQWRKNNPDKMHAYRNAHVKKLKDETFTAYGGYICSCCGETEKLFMTIDHINGGGNTHRKSLGNAGGKDFYTWLRKNGYPEGYQVLCYNCNISKGHYGICPHQEL